MILLFLMCAVLTANADLLLDMYRETVDHNVSPCENFYRHACRLGSKNIDTRFIEAMRNQSNPFTKTLFSQFNSTVLNDQNVLIDFNSKSNLEDLIVEQYYDWCENEETDKMRYFSMRLTSQSRMGNNTNCTTEAENVKNLLETRKIDSETTKFASTAILLFALEAGFQELSERDTFISETFETMREMILMLLEQTPWARNYHVIKQYRKYIENIELGLPEISRDGIRRFNKLERKYSECNEKLKSKTTDLKLICFIIVVCTSFLPDHRTSFSNAQNVYNSELLFDSLFYYLSAKDGGRATNMGFTAQTIGHEFSHTLFDDNLWPQYDYFSEVAKNCVSKQFNSTCIHYKEESCSMTDQHLEECGADMIGQRLGYEILKQQFSSRIHDLYPGTNATHQQLYFYGYAFHSCEGHLSENYNGKHPPGNIRVNSVVQLPEFQEAFNCPNDSQMMKTRTEECFFYGPQAPETKRRYNRG